MQTGPKYVVRTVLQPPLALEESALTVARGVLESIFVPSNLPSAQR